MKKKILTIVIGYLGLLNYGCKPSSAEISTTNELSKLKISNILSMTSVIDQKVAYRTLTAEEKAIVWQQHLTNEIQNGNYSSAQIAMLTEMRNYVNPDFFKTTARTISTFEHDWNLRALGLFSEGELFNAVGTLSMNPKITLKIQTEAMSDCACSTTSDWCGSTFHCKSTSSCTVVQNDCGTLWNYACVGFCEKNDSRVD